MYVDRFLNASGSRAGLIFTSLKGKDIQYTLRFRFPSTNNEAEYEALLASLKISKQLGVQHLKAYSDSQLVVGHMLNEYEARKESMKK